MARETAAKKVTFFPFQEETNDFGAPIALINCVSFNTKNNYKEVEYSSDGKVERSSSKLQSVDVEMEMSSSMMPAIMSKITGQVYSKAKLVTRVGTSIPQGAIAYEIEMDDGSYRRRVLYNVNLKKDEQNNTTESDGETYTFSGKAIPFEAIPGQYDVDLLMDSTEVAALTEDDVAIKTEFENFFTKVVLPTV